MATSGSLVARRFGAPLLVISQDVFPEIAERVKRLEHPLVVGALRQLVGALPPARRPCGRDRRDDEAPTRGEGRAAGRVEVIPNWVDTTRAHAAAARQRLGAEHGLDDAFVVMHSGNVGHAQDLDALVRAATFLRDLDGLQIIVIGFGARHGEFLRLAQRLEVT